MYYFAMHHEAKDDPKFRRICRQVRKSKLEVLGAWVILLSMASESPERGKLLIADDLPYALDDIADELGLTSAETDNLLNAMESLGMVGFEDSTWFISNWDKRQPESAADKRRKSAAERKRKQRERAKQEPPPDGFSHRVFDYLKSCGVNEPQLSELSNGDYSAEFVRGHVESAENIGMAIYRIRERWEVPEQEKPKAKTRQRKAAAPRLTQGQKALATYAQRRAR